MAKGKQDADIVLRCVDEIKNAVDFMVCFIPCIIPQSDDEEKQLQADYKVLKQVSKFIKDCDGDIGFLDEMFDTDKIVAEYPKFEGTFKSGEWDG